MDLAHPKGDRQTPSSCFFWANSLQDKTFKTLFQALDVEIKEKSIPDTSQFHLGKQLRIVYAGKVLHTFEFEDDLILHQDIDAVSTVQAKAFVFYGKWMLQQERDAL